MSFFFQLSVGNHIRIEGVKGQLWLACERGKSSFIDYFMITLSMHANVDSDGSSKSKKLLFVTYSTVDLGHNNKDTTIRFQFEYHGVM